MTTPNGKSLTDCPSNLKEAIDWILRVTGNDGQGGRDNTSVLAKAVKELLESAVRDVESLTSNRHKNDTELQKLKTGLEKAKAWFGKDVTGDTDFEYVGTGGPIGMLAEGLQKFIGYGSKGILSDPPTAGKLTGAGIAPSNIATHRLCDAAIAFTIGVLEGCKKKVNHNKYPTALEKLNYAIGNLYSCCGQGPKTLSGITSSMSELNGNNFNNTPVKAFVNDIKIAFETNLQNISPDSADNVATKVGAYLKGVFQNWSTDGGNNITNSLQKVCQQFNSDNIYDPQKSNSQINAVGSALNPKTGVVQPILTSGKNAFMETLKRANYTRMDYEAASSIQWSNETAKIQKCAKIFLSCLPLYYQALTYIYWGCHDKGGGWGNQTLATGAMRSYFDSQGLLPIFVDRSKRGAHIAKSALGGFQTEFTQGMAGAPSPPTFPYISFTKKLQEKVTTNGNHLPTDCPLSALLYGASCYFRYQQITNAKSAVRAPKTIREMLYFLAALPYSSAYDEINGHIGTLLTTELSVADSALNTPSNKLSADQLNEYFRASCAFASSVLGMVQGPGASQNASDPWLFELFCNSAFQFKYPSGDSLFSTISNYAYALQFQLLFLYSMCANNVDKCGWQHCTYGSEMNKNASGSLQSHICPGLKCNGQSGCWHNGTGNTTDCKHNKAWDEASCGHSNGNVSPLQAFLTDCINGLCRSHPTNSTSHLSTCSGALCHVPMGFQATHLRHKAANGARVYLVLKAICGSPTSPLRQLCEKLGCLTKRTPRSLGDLFGFLWHLNGQLFPKTSQSDITTATWFNKLKDNLPFSYQLNKDSGKNLKKFVGTDHKTHNTSSADLTSLHNSKCNESNQTCGPYLSPLTLSHGATFGKPAPYASTYLSWMVYLTDDLETGFQELLHEFKNIDCSKTGCRAKAGGQEACKSKPHPPGTHGTGSDACSCDSVVHCGGVLPLLYRYGFTFSDIGALFGEGANGTKTKRTCEHFHTQLQSVISGEPLRDLFTSIDNFLYAIRWEFFSKLSGFWTIYVCVILYTFFFLLDTLHMRSHLKLTSSHPGTTHWPAHLGQASTRHETHVHRAVTCNTQKCSSPTTHDHTAHQWSNEVDTMSD
ncbi:uncharacterized protein BcabD6B2_44480 [Babesia caballi]|uniref:Variant erythrocyte surface antigen-1, beta subunit n=1 Tax=Babesia caballi TaxID=5871 RepID=A0AAV4LZ59_BABCB|nr:hypothetical protein, conserved [Babesia caballi]